MGWFKRAAKGTGRFLWSGAGAGIITVAAGAVTGQSEVVTAGLQLTTGGLVKKASKKAGRGLHRIMSPAVSMGTLAIAQAAGLDAPVELVSAAATDASGATAAVEFLLNGLLPGGVQSTSNGVRKTFRDYREKGAY